LYSHTLLYGHPQRYLSGSFFQASLMEKAKVAGANIMLTGHSGDQIVDNGFDIITQVFERKNWKYLNHLLDQRAFFASQTANFSNWDSLNDDQRKNLFKQHFLFKKFLSIVKKGNIRESLEHLYKWHSHVGLSADYFIKSLWRTIYNKVEWNNDNYISILNPEFAEQISNHSNKNFVPYIEEYKNWATGIYTTQGIGISEEFFCLGNEYKIIPLYPFCDKNLYQFSLSVPQIIKFDSGLGRGHFREAMKGILPENIRSRPNKTHFGLYAREVALQSYSQSKDLLFTTNEVWNYIDKKKFQNAVNKITLEKEKNTTNALLINRAISLAVWLDINKSGAYRT
jgi:asparagine synthase (glutamine-hydrolysing)